ncbi:signal peptidase II [Candidatus Woesearchaeota archaeon]|nr:signal peptidase II [Candidatus Woesearchaeota archaeon]
MDRFNRNSWLLLVLIFLDQIVKNLIESQKPVIEFGWLTIHQVHNTGASFGMLQGSNTVLIFVSMIVLGIIMMNVKSIKRTQELPTIILIAGIIGNLIDRVFRGFVVDFFDLGWWPAFNVADCCIVLGVAWLIIVLVVEEWKAKPVVKEKASEPRLNQKASKARRGLKKVLISGKKKAKTKS